MNTAVYRKDLHVCARVCVCAGEELPTCYMYKQPKDVSSALRHTLSLRAIHCSSVHTHNQHLLGVAFLWLIDPAVTMNYIIIC